MYDRIYKYKRLTFYIGISVWISFASSVNAAQLSIFIKSLDSREPVQGAVIDLHACNLGKFFSDEKGKVQIQSDNLESCVMYISASGYISLVRNFSLDSSGSGDKLTVYMQRQDKYKYGRLWSSGDQSPIPGVEVVIQEKNSNEKYSVFTDKYGQFSLVHNSNEAIQLQFIHSDYQNLEKIIYFRKEMAGLGSFFMHPLQVEREKKEMIPPKLKGYESKKFTFRKRTTEENQIPENRHIIVLALLKDSDNLNTKFPGLELSTKTIGNWTQVYLGPYTTKKNALQKLSEVDEKYPNAKLKTL